MHRLLWYLASCFSLSAVGRRVVQNEPDRIYEADRSKSSQDEALTNVLLDIGLQRIARSSARPYPSSLSLPRSSNSLMMGRKFENNKAKMAKTALQNSKKASLIGKKIKVALKSGNTDPSENMQLAAVMKEANAMNVKKEIVDRAIKAAASADAADFSELTYEIYGAGAAGFVINALSDNPKRTFMQVGTVAKKLGLKIADQGSVLAKFENKARLTLNSEISEDHMIELALDSDIDDVSLAEPCRGGIRSDGDMVKSVIFTEPESLSLMQKAVEADGIECVASLVHEPLYLAEGLSDEDFDLNMQLLDKLEEVEDVDSIEHNMAMNE